MGVHRLAGVAVDQALAAAQGGGVLVAEEELAAAGVVVEAEVVVVVVEEEEPAGVVPAHAGLAGDKVTRVSGPAQVLRGGTSSP